MDKDVCEGYVCMCETEHSCTIVIDFLARFKAPPPKERQGVDDDDALEGILS